MSNVNQDNQEFKVSKKKLAIDFFKTWLVMFPLCIGVTHTYKQSERMWMEELDQTAQLDCAELKNATETGNYDYLSYNYPGLFNLGEKYKTVAHYQLGQDYTFKQCQADIEEERSVWCKDAVSDISTKAYSVQESIYIDEDVRKLCAQEINDRFTIFHGKPFQTLAGVDGVAIKHGDSWVSAKELRIGEPAPVHVQQGIEFGKLCVSDVCGMYGSMDEARKEQERLLDLAYGLSAYRTINKIKVTEEAAK